VTVNCGAIPEGLIESELFGHEKGAFTGATNQRKGFFEAAQEGTLFLDEIGDMPLALQVKLLRALETGTFTRVGSTTLQKTNARIVAATNRDLERDVRAGTFRSDLYYRLRAVMLRIPPLRNRREDIPFLIEAMLDEFVHKHRIVGPDGKPRMPQIAPDAIQLLIDHEWRGNIRELRNTLEQLVVLVCSVQSLDGVCRISAQDIERALSSSILGSSASGWDGARSERPLPAASVTRENPATERELIYRALIELRADLAEVKELLRQKEVAPVATNTLALPARTEEIKTLQQLENEEIQKSLNRYDGNRRNAAHALGISERSLYRKLKEMGIE
jgi:DNA-binding NtrC family response regulator